MTSFISSQKAETGKWFLPENKPEQCNLCEVCFKPFNLANIDMHLEAGCAAEIYLRYNVTTKDTSKKDSREKTSRRKSDKCSISSKKSFGKTGKRTKKMSS